MGRTLPIVFLTLLLFSAEFLYAQCTDGTQPECTCGSAPVLCTVDQLDQYQFGMSTFQHPQDGPTPLCPGANNTQANNPTWFAFTAWCTDLTLNVSFANCVPGTNGTSIGVQIAIYNDCTFTSPVDCNVSAADCNTADKVLNLTGLTIGGVYYFLVDGCLGSACDVTIDVIGTCGAEAIDPWTMPITGELGPCVGDTETYSVEMLPGAQTYHWYVDNVLQGMTSTTTFDQTWTTAGTYQLCVDASNDPCVPVTDPPAPNCITITVGDVDAGMLTINPTTLCPDEFAFIMATGYTMHPNNSQAIIVTDAAGVIVQVTPGDAATYTSSVCGTFTVYSYNYLTATGTVPVVGQNISGIDCVVNCCDLVSETISFEDTVDPVFPNPPADLVLDCADLIPAMTDLTWTDNCDGTGVVAGMEQGNITTCAGGTLTRAWEYTDACNNLGSHIQTITVNPTPAPAFVNPPASMTVDCDNIPTSAPDLSYTNNGVGACDISGVVPPQQSGSADNCGGTITYTWDFTDACGNNLNHVQTITVNPAPVPAFVNPPASQTVSCDNVPTSAPDLTYTNNATGSCLVTGTISPTQSGSADICGGTITFEWLFVDPCGSNLTHTQTITVTPASPAAFVNPPADVTVSCDNIPTSAPDLNYTNNEIGTCLVSGVATAVQDGTADICGGSFLYKWEFLDPCGNVIEHNQTVTIDPAAPPVFQNPPADMTVSCDNIPTGGGDLSYTNNEGGLCLVSGTVSATPSGSADICGGTITYTWNFTDPCGVTITHVQNITVDPALAPTFQNPPADMTVSCDNIPSSAPDLNYTNNDVGSCLISGSVPATQSGNVDACGGTISFTWNFTDACGNVLTHVQNITVDPAPPAAFTSALPGDITVACNAVPTSAPSLNYTNNQTGTCEISGVQPATQSGSFDACGGTIQFIWEFTDACGRTIQHAQNVTVQPAPGPTFTNPPGPVTLNCSAVPASPPTLSYTNGGSGQCAISGSVPAIQSGFYDACGGSITYTWTFTDPCNNTISHSQNIQVNPASDPMFVNPQPDITINCGQPFPSNVPLDYTNNETGACGIMGTVIATESLVGLTTTYNWIFTNACNGFTITHTQNVTQTAAPDIVLNPFQVDICAGQNFDLGTIAVTDLNGTNPVITFHTGTPADFGNQLPNGIVSPPFSTTYYILASNSFGCSDEAPLDIIVEDPPNAGNDGSGTICYQDAFSVNFFDFLLGAPPQTGTWNDFNLYGVDVSNPYAVNLSGLAPGSYTFSYSLSSPGVCPDDMAFITLEVLPEIFFEASNIVCSADPNFYEVTINSFGFEINNLSGTATDLGGGIILISNIPIGDILVISATNPGNPLCLQFLSIVPPDCDCPTIDPPVNDGNASICFGETNPELSVTVNAGETANWFDAPSGGALLLAGSLTYTPTETAPGIYTYYVQAEEITSGCVSSILTPVQFEIIAIPIGNNAQLALCDDGDGFVEFDLSLAELLISSDPSNTFIFYPTLLDAQNQTNPLPVNYTNTATPGQTIFVVMSNSQNCSSMVELELLVNPAPAITLQIANETCLGDGDGSVTINSPQGMNYSLDGVTWTTNTIFPGLIPNSYTAYVEDNLGCIASQNFVIEPGLEMLIDLLEVVCNSNGTASDATDDFYDISFSLTNNNSNSGTYSINDGTAIQGPFNYNQSYSITLPAMGQSVTLTFTDDLLACQITQAIGPLTSCSTDCIITINQLDIDCSDNGTGNDATDDIYTITINASAINGSATGTYNVLIDATLNYNFPYNIASTFTLPADGSSPIITVVDNQDAQCQASQTIGPLVPCSDACVIQFETLDFVCNDNGTITDPADDFYNINIQASAVNPGATNSFEIFADNISQGIFTYATGGSFTLAADGATVQIEIQDADEPLCFATQDIGPLDPCNEDCTINATVSNIVCDDNGTIQDATDDTFTFDVLVNGQNVGSGWESTDGTLTGNYGAVESFGPYLITDGDLNFDLEDLGTAGCLALINVPAPAACSDPCTISFDLVEFICNDNGTITDPADDFYDINIQASATNAGATNSFEIFADNISQGIFTYATGGTFTLPADGATVQIEIQDADEPLCLATQDIGPLDPCNADCSINATVSNIVCDNNGTIQDATDDTFTFDVLVNGQNVGSGWESTDGALSGNYGVVENFGPYLITDGDLNFDLEDLSTAGCLALINVPAPAACSDPCAISFDLVEFICNDNGTITDPADDFYDINIQASATNAGATNSFEIFADNISQGIFTYATGGTFILPADGATVQIEIQDADESLCLATQDIGPLDPCNADCTINAAVSNIVCDNNGTIQDATDDTFTFDVLVNGQNVGSGWESTDGTLSGNYGVVENFGPYLITDGDLNFDLEDLGTAGCLAFINVPAPAACSDPCIINFDLVEFICNDNGTITDPADDFYDINIQASAMNAGATNSFEIFADNISQGIFTYATGGTFILPADGSTVAIEIQDADEPLCLATQDIGPLDPCNEDCTINATVSNIVCDNNGTGQDPTDDTFTFDVLVNGQNVGSGWESTDGALSGNYGVVGNFGPYLISGGDLDFDLEDLVTSGCLAMINVPAPATCSDDCSISFELVDFTCNDNGTITDPLDDFYDITIQATAINPGAANSFEIFADNVSQGIFTYSAGGTFILPADGATVQIEIQDADDPLCFTTQDIGPLDPCNEDCTINATVSNIVCNDNGTGQDPTDDTFTFDVLVNGQNVGSGWESTDGTLSGIYGTVETFGPYLITDGDLNFDLEDLTTPGCLAMINVPAPPACSDPCTINFELVDFICDDNGTITDPADDFYNVAIQASAINPGLANSFEVFADNVSQGIFTYATGGTFILPANGAMVQLEIQDADEPLCLATQTIGPLDPCNEDCTINASVSNIVCDDNGTIQDPTDDTFTFDVLVNGQNVGSGWESTDGTLSGTYGAVESFGPYLITGGDLNFDLEDLTTPGCLAMINVPAPVACSDPCIISFDLLDFTCDDNGTLTIPADDFYTINIQASAINAGVTNSFEVFVDNISQGIFTYTTGATFTLPANGATVAIEIQDVDEPLCSATQNIGPLDPCAEDCTISASVSNIVCDNGGTGNDSTDDTFTFDVLVNGQNVGNGWASTDGTLSGGYGVVENFGPYLITGGDLNFDLEDLVTPNCIANIIVTAPPACSSCGQTIDAGLTDTITCEITSVDLIGMTSEPGTYTWTGPNSFSANTLTTSTNQPGWYYLLGSYAENCTALDSVFIAIENNVPTADAGPDQTITCDQMEVTLDGSGSTGDNLSYEWTDADGNFISDQPTITVGTIGIYTLEVVDGISGCVAMDAAEVLDDTGLPSAIIYADPVDILDCVVNTISLSTANEQDVIYDWNSEVIGPIYQVSEAGVVILIATDTITGCQNTSQIDIADLEDYPLVDLVPATPLSCYNPEIIIDGSGSQAGTTIVYNWFDEGNNLIVGENSNMLQVDLGGFYYLQLLDTLNGCQNTDTVFVESLFDLPLSQAVEDVNLYCAEAQTSLALEILGTPGSVNITWSSAQGEIVSGGSTQNPVVNGAGVYTVAMQDVTSGCISEDSLLVTVDEDVPEFANAQVQAENCVDENDGLISISDINGGQAPYIYSFNGSTPSSANEFPDLSPGQYALQIQDDNGCLLDTSFVVDPGIDLEVDLPAVIELLEDQNGNIQAVINVPEEDIDVIQWSPPGLLSCDTCLITSIIAEENQIFQLFIQHENGCLTIAELRIEVKPKSRVYIPNAFSPNGDANNETFTLYGNEQVEEIETLIIFDRWGEFVFQNNNFAPNNPSLGWDGRLKGEDMNPAVFVYYFRVRMLDGSVEEFSGDVTLVR